MIKTLSSHALGALLILVGTGSASALAAPQHDAVLKNVFPGLPVFESVLESDFNKDGMNDFAAVLLEPKKTPQSMPMGRLVIYFGQPQGEFKRFLSTTSVNSAPLPGVTYTNTDPAFNIRLNPKGLLQIIYSGGASTKWSGTYLWRWDATQNDFLMIGATHSTATPMPSGMMGTEVTDINYSTLNLERK
jgi:hypothetical protein